MSVRYAQRLERAFSDGMHTAKGPPHAASPRDILRLAPAPPSLPLSPPYPPSGRPSARPPPQPPPFVVSDLYLDTDSTIADPLLERLRMATAGTYDIAGVLGRGGMAVVFVGEDMRLRRTVAIKVMEPHLGALPGMAERFLEEARTLAHLQHPNIITVHDVQQAKGLSFFVMALIEGGGVDQLCRRPEPFPIDQARWILLQASSALAYAHSERIIHRDVKPANILVNIKGDAVLTDFGIAKVSDGGGLTKSGTQIGTPVYMSPEQFSETPIGPASDQYALGVTAYEMLTGKPPFTGDLYTIIAAHGVKPPVPIRQLRPDCPAYLANAVMRMLEKKPEDRWPSLEDLREVFGANMPSNGGDARKQLATIAREMHRARREDVKALSAEAPQSPVPTNANRPITKARTVNHSVTVWPPAATIYVGGTLDLRASVTTDAGDTLTDSVIVWSSSHPEFVEVDATGKLRGVAHGTAVISATVDGVSAESTITSDLAPVARLAVSQRELTLLVGDIVQPTVSAIDVTGATRTDVSLAWISRGPTVAHLDAPGSVRALNPGLAVIEVSFGNVRQTIEITVVRRPVTKLQIRPVKPFVELGATLPLVADAFDDRGDAVKVTQLKWRSSAPSIIHVDSAGKALAIGEGSARIMVEVDDISDAIELTAIESPVASLTFAMATAVLEIGDEESLQLIVTDTTGGRRSMDGVRIWSGAPDILALDSTRMVVTALSAGIATLQASTVGADGSLGPSTAASVTVYEPAIARIVVERTELDLESGAMVSLSARAIDRRGRPVKNADITWESVTPQVVSVAGAGLLCAVSAGSGAVIARATNPGRGTIETRITVHVQAQVVTPPPVVPVYVPPPAPDAATVRIPSPTPAAAHEPQVARPAVNTPPPLEAIAWNPAATPSAKPAPSGATVPVEKVVVDQLRAAVTPSTAKTLVTPTPKATPRPQAVPKQKSALVDDGVADTTPKKRTAVAGLAAAVLVVAIGGWLAMRDRAPAQVGDAVVDTSGPKQTDSAHAAADRANSDSGRRRDTSDAIVTSIDSSGIKKTKLSEANKPLDKPKPKTDSTKARRRGELVDSVIRPPQRDTTSRVDSIKVKPVVPIEVKKVVVPRPPVDTTSTDVAALALPSDAEMRTAAENVVRGIRARQELAEFFSDGADHKVALASAPSRRSESVGSGRSRAEFIIRLTKRDFSGTAIVRNATVTIDVVKRDGNTSSTIVSVGPLRKQ